MKQFNNFNENKNYGLQESQKYILDAPQDVITIDMSENNYINIEDTDSFKKIPRLAHNLEEMVHQRGEYFIDDIAKL